MSQIEIARAIAHVAHRGQTDKAGNPYIEHPQRVAARLARGNRSTNIIAAGWLHDVLEDSDLTREDLFAAGVEWVVISCVEFVTRTSEVPVEEYYARIGRAPDAKAVKLADIADNTAPERLALLDDATVARLTRKYAKARMLIEAA